MIPRFNSFEEVQAVVERMESEAYGARMQAASRRGEDSGVEAEEEEDEEEEENEDDDEEEERRGA